ncbi:MAG: tyrosine-type recombinase/integrase [Balneolaceae bacterium]|nr:tyrosine-type recombinase/integrase [Balneolaceae bacterium]
MANKNLTDPFIRNLKPPKKRTEIYDNLITGLAVRVTPTGHKSFVYRYRIKDKVKRFTMGSFPKMGLSTAREEAKKLWFDISNGIDPLAEKKKQKSKPDPTLFKELAQEFKEKYLPTLREKTQKEYKRIVDNELVPALGDLPIKEVSKHEIISMLDDKAYEDGSPTMANRMRARLSKIYSFAVGRGLAEYNPVSTIPTYQEGENKRDRYYNEKEIKKLWEAFEKQDEPARSIFKLLLLTGQRKGETSRMRWECIQGDVWTIPAKDAKGKRPHDVPLPPAAIDILKEIKSQKRKSAYVFESPVIEGEPIQELKRVVEKIRNESKVKDFRPHDLRRTAATYMAKLGIDRTVLGKILNHKGLAGDGQVTAIYDRHSYMEEKRNALELWAKHLQKILSEKK